MEPSGQNCTAGQGSSTAKTTEEAKELVEAGFEYICTTPQDVMLFRKRK
jgi:hypothetical protein